MNTYADYLNILELSENASLEDIKNSYRGLVRIWHPDKFESNENIKKRVTEKVKKLNEAYDYLRKNYTEDFFTGEYKFNENSEELEKNENFSKNKTSQQSYCTDFKIEDDNFDIYTKNRLKYPKFELPFWLKVFISAICTMLIMIIM